MEHTDLVRDGAGLLDAGSDSADQSRFLAVAGKVGQGGASIRGKSRDEAVKLEAMSVLDTGGDWKDTNRAGGNIGKLSVGQAGSNECNKSGRELHFAEYM